MNRRQFIGKAAAATGAAFTIVQPHHVRGTQANAKIKTGCIGLGGRGGMIRAMICRHEGYQISALCDYFPDRARKHAEQIGLNESACFSGLEGYKGLIDSGVEAVFLETPPCFFPIHAEQAFKSGCHIFVAKPIAVDVPGTLKFREIAEKAKANRQVVHVDFQMRVNPYMIECIRHVREGYLKDCKYVRAWYDDEMDTDRPFKSIEERLVSLIWVSDIALGGGKLVNAGIHALDAALWVLDQHPISAVGSNAITRPGVYGDSRDVYSLTYNFADGAILNYHGEHYRNNHSDIAGLMAFGQGAHMEGHYHGECFIKGNRDQYYRGGKQPNIYRWGAEENIRLFHKAITSGDFSNPTCEPSVISNLACILGREAGNQRRLMTWDQLLKDTTRLEPDLSDLKK